jgi:hypothetical protein
MPGILVTAASKHKIQGGYLYEYFLQKFGSVYSPKQELSLDEVIIS